MGAYRDYLKKNPPVLPRGQAPGQAPKQAPKPDPEFGPQLPFPQSGWDADGQRHFLALCKWWGEFEAHPECTPAVKAAVSYYIPYPGQYYERGPNEYWATVHAYRAGARNLKGLLGKYYDRRGEDRAKYGKR